MYPAKQWFRLFFVLWSALAAASATADSGSARPPQRVVTAVVESRLMADLAEELEVWTKDLAAEGLEVRVLAFSPGGRAPELRELLRAEYRDQGIEGALLIGNLPLAWYENEIEGSYPYLLDYYFEELTGAWSDGDGDGWLDDHSDPDHGPEIYLGRLRADNTGSPEVPALKAYFSRNHAFRRGLDQPPARSLLLSPGEHPEGYRAETLYGPAQATRLEKLSGTDFRTRLARESAEVLTIIAHSTETGMRFLEPESWVSSMDLRAIEKRYPFVILHDCGAGDLSVNANLVSAFLFSRSQALAVVTVMKAAGSSYFDYYFLSDRLRTETCLGLALREHKRRWASDNVEASDEGEFHIFGDPSLRLSTAFRRDLKPYEAAAPAGWKTFDNSYRYSLAELGRLGAYYDLRYFKVNEGKGGGSPWGRYQNRSFGDLGGDIHAAKGSTAGVEFLFYGDGVEFYSETAPDHGSFEVFLDGQAAGRIDLGAPRKGQVKLFEYSWPTNGNHVLRLLSADPTRWAAVDFFRAHVR